MTLHLYQDKKREWRWRLKSTNGKVLADSGEGYKRMGMAKKIAVKLFPDAKVTIEEPDKTRGLDQALARRGIAIQPTGKSRMQNNRARMSTKARRILSEVKRQEQEDCQ